MGSDISLILRTTPPSPIPAKSVIEVNDQGYYSQESE